MSQRYGPHSHDPRYEELLPSLALGILEERERDDLLAHLSTGCRTCHDLLGGYEDDLAALAATVPPVVPSELTRKRLLRRIGAVTVTHPVPVRERRPLTPGWALAASLLACALGLLGLVRAVRLEGELGDARTTTTRLERELDQARSELALQAAHLERLALAVQALGAPGGHAYALAGLGGAPGAGGAAFVDPGSHRAVFYAYGLPALPPDRDYQLWWIEDGRPVSAGVLPVDRRGSGTLEVPAVPFDRLQVWAVTIEPKGGVPQPTGEMVLKS
jgi:anti-sigma-K factor RskA